MTDSFWSDDPSLQRLLWRRLQPEMREWGQPLLERAGTLAAGVLDELAFQADQNGPVLKTHDRNGTRIDEVVFHPAYREMERLVYGELGVVGMIYGQSPPGRTVPPGGRAPRVLAFGVGHVASQSDAGLFCPVCMTDGVARVLEKHASPEVRDAFIPHLAATDRAELYSGAMFLTERQGGSDVGANTCQAQQENGTWRLYGDKWFCSNVNAEAILALARPDDAQPGTRGLGLFLVRSHLPDGSRNGFRIHRIKDKLGVRGMATGEITFDGAEAQLIGGPGQGFKQMVSMVNLSRLYNANASIAAMRRAWREAAEYAKDREAFGQRVDRYPLHRATVGKLAVECEGARQLVFAAVDAMDRADAGDEAAAQLLRAFTPMTKFTTGKMAVAHASEAMEVLGGNGYIEEFVTARLLRDAQVLPIWEGTTNIQVLDVLRVIVKEEGHQILLERVREALASVGDDELKTLAQRLEAVADAQATELDRIRTTEQGREIAVRRWAERTAALYSGCLLLQAAHASLEEKGDARDVAVARVFLDLRFGPGHAEELADRYYDAIALNETLDPGEAWESV